MRGQCTLLRLLIKSLTGPEGGRMVSGRSVGPFIDRSSNTGHEQPSPVCYSNPNIISLTIRILGRRPLINEAMGR